jgi:putative FmdB family regulatory protein
LPLYAYRCTDCGYRFEIVQHFNDALKKECPKCHGVLERPLTAPAFKFKGSGFYVTDYAGKSSVPAAESAPAETKPPCGGKCGAVCPAAAAASATAAN